MRNIRCLVAIAVDMREPAAMPMQGLPRRRAALRAIADRSARLCRVLDEVELPPRPTPAPLASRCRINALHAHYH